MNMIRNIQFSVLISINKKFREFNFRQRTACLYDTDTPGERGERCFLKIMKVDDNWEIQGNDLPSWIADNRSLILDALFRERAVINQAC